MRKYVFNKQILGAVLSGMSTLKIAKAGPRDWRLGLLVVIWGLGVAVAVGTIATEAKEAEARLDSDPRPPRRAS